MKRWGAVLTISLCVSILLTKMVANALSASWFDTLQQPTIQKTGESASTQKVTYWGADCSDTNLQYNYIDSYGNASKQRDTSCVPRESYGYMSTHGLQLSGTNTTYPIYSLQNTPVPVYPIHGGKDVAYYGPTGSTTYKKLYIYKNLPLGITVQKDANGEVKYYKLNGEYNAVANRVMLPDGYQAEVQDMTPTYSAGGEYMFANMGRAQVLVNVETQTARILGQNTNPSSGIPKVSLAVNDDASLVFVADNNRGTYKIYDTTNCSPGSSLSNPEACSARDISSMVRGAATSIKQISRANFIGNDQLALYITVNTDTGARTDRYVVSAPGFQQPNFDYLALGDSFASGEGAYDYTAATDGDTNHCHISSNSYEYLITAQLGFANQASVACSGAKMKDVYRDNNKDYAKDNPQAQGKDDDQYTEEIITGFLPGYRRQFEFVKRYKPAAITLSISGNNINFGKKLQYCILTQYSCYESAGQKQNILNEIKAQFPTLVKTYTDIHNASPDTRIYVVGYPRLVLPGGNCALNVHLSDAELTLADEITEDLDTMIHRAADKAGVFYVDTTDSFMGHRLCEDKSWNLAVNGLTFGTDQPFGIGPIASATFHPNKMGHQLFASTILDQTDSLTKPMPAPDDSANVDDMPSRLSPTGDTTGTSQQPILDDGLFGSLVQIGDKAATLITNIGNYFTAGDIFAVELHSDPIQIGTATAIDNETLSLDATIPAGAEPGPHEVHIYGNNIAGEPIDIYQNVLLIASQDDYDGDGIPNIADQCTFITPSGVDSDADGVDDACEPVVGEAPTNPEDTTDPKVDSHHDIATIVSTITHSINEYVHSLSEKDRAHVGNTVARVHSKKSPKDSDKGAKKQHLNPLLVLLTTTPLGILAFILIDL